MSILSKVSKVSSLKPGTKKLMEVLKRIRNMQTGAKSKINLSPKGFGQPIKTIYGRSGQISDPAAVRLITAGRARRALAQSHRQVKRIGKGKGYRDYLKKMK